MNRHIVDFIIEGLRNNSFPTDEDYDDHWGCWYI